MHVLLEGWRRLDGSREALAKRVTTTYCAAPAFLLTPFSLEREHIQVMNMIGAAGTERFKRHSGRLHTVARRHQHTGYYRGDSR